MAAIAMASSPSARSIPIITESRSATATGARSAIRATAAATGAITGAVVILGERAIFDLPTAAIALISLGALWRFKLHEPVIVSGAGLAGLVLWPLVHGGT